MRDVNRINPILDRLKTIWRRNPDLRLGQLILNALRDPTLYYIEDEQLIEILEKAYGRGVQ